MRILDRYILKPILTFFLGCLFVFIFLYIIADLLGRLDDILRNHASFITIYQYYSTYFPIIFTQTSPIAMLLATVYTFAKLNRNNELIAIRSSGLSIWQVIKPTLIAASMLSVVIFFVSESLVPQAQHQAEKIKAHLEGNKDAAALKEEIIQNLTFYGLENRLFFVNSFDTKNNIMKGITVLQQDKNQDLTAKIVATKGAYINNIWIFYEFTKFYFAKYGQISGETLYSEEQIMDITETPQDFLQQRQRPEFMKIGQLEDYIWRLQRSGATSAARNLQVDLYNRYAAATSCLILILAGIPFSFITRKRANIFSSFGVSIAISFLYFILSAVSLAVGKNGWLPAFAAAWGTPMLFCLLAIKAVTKVS